MSHFIKWSPTKTIPITSHAMAKQQGGNFKGSKHQRSKKKKNTGQSKQDGGILPWLLFKGLSSGGRRRRRRRRSPSYYSQPRPQPYRRPRSMYISVNNTQFSRTQKMHKPVQQQQQQPQMGTNRYKMYSPQPQKQTGL